MKFLIYEKILKLLKKTLNNGTFYILLKHLWHHDHRSLPTISLGKENCHNITIFEETFHVKCAASVFMIDVPQSCWFTFAYVTMGNGTEVSPLWTCQECTCGPCDLHGFEGWIGADLCLAYRKGGPVHREGRQTSHERILCRVWVSITPHKGILQVNIHLVLMRWCDRFVPRYRNIVRRHCKRRGTWWG